MKITLLLLSFSIPIDRAIESSGASDYDGVVRARKIDIALSGGSTVKKR